MKSLRYAAITLLREEDNRRFGSLKLAVALVSEQQLDSLTRSFHLILSHSISFVLATMAKHSVGVWRGMPWMCWLMVALVGFLAVESHAAKNYKPIVSQIMAAALNNTRAYERLCYMCGIDIAIEISSSPRSREWR